MAGLAVLVMGAGTGLALGGFATGQAPPSPTDSLLTTSDAQSVEPIETPMPAVQNGPERYVCHGCGPTLAERNAQAYSAHYAAADPGYDAAYRLADDYVPLPAYRPIPYEGDEPRDQEWVEHN